MDDPESSEEPTAACAEDLERLRKLGATLRREREERQRTERVGEETSKLFHTLNNVLSIISTFAASLSDEVETDHPSRESVEEIARAAKRAVSIARKIAEVQRRISGGQPPGHGRA